MTSSQENAIAGPNKEVIDTLVYVESRGFTQDEATSLIFKGQIVEFIRFGERFLSLLGEMV